MDVSRSRVGKGLFDVLEVGGVLAQFGEVAAEFGSEPPEADEDESLGAVAASRYLDRGKAFGAVQQKNEVRRCLADAVLGIEGFGEGEGLAGNVFAG